MPSSASGLPRRPVFDRILLCTAFAGLAVHVLHGALRIGSPELDWLFNDWIYNGVLIAAVAACLGRGITVPTERAAWLLIGTGLASWTMGDVYWTLAFRHAGSIPYPSLADVFYLGMYRSYTRA
jgi:hypothetical protein